MNTHICPLCRTEPAGAFARAHQRSYFTCDRCELVFLAPEQRLGPRAEHAHYATHQNHPDDPGYRSFLSRLATPLAQCLPPGAVGLDYGSGPGPTLSLMLQEQGFAMSVYDPFFAIDEDPLQRTYDFITCTEAAEHFFHPGDEFERLSRLLRPGGWLALMTELVSEDRPFEKWYYPRDPTHVCFYRPGTLRWLAKKYDWSLRTPHRNVALFQSS